MQNISQNMTKNHFIMGTPAETENNTNLSQLLLNQKQAQMWIIACSLGKQWCTCTSVDKYTQNQLYVHYLKWIDRQTTPWKFHLKCFLCENYCHHCCHLHKIYLTGILRILIFASLINWMIVVENVLRNLLEDCSFSFSHEITNEHLTWNQERGTYD